MKRVSQCLLMMIIILITFNAFAKPGFIVTPFSRSITMAPNSTQNVLIIAQNATGVNQTITNIVPTIPADSGISGSVINNSCGFLSPGNSCEALVKLQSTNQPSTGNLNTSVCSFNGTFCSQIIKPIDFFNVHPVNISITPTNPTIANGTTKQFIATGFFANTTIQDITSSVIWSSSDTSKASISNASGSEGLATGVGVGSSVISATLEGTSGSTILTVTGATLISITVTPTNPSVPNISTEQFTATGIFSDNSNQDLTSQVTWSSSNTAVATISNASSQKGLATTKSVGGTTITATFGAFSGSTTLTVTPAVLTSISVTPTNSTIPINTNQQFAATGIYSDNSVKDLTNVVNWSTKSTLVAIVSNQAGSKGEALGVGVGSTNVIATLGAISGSTTLTVAPAVLTSITVTPTNPSVPHLSTKQFTAIGIYSNNSIEDLTSRVTWISSNTAVATISNIIDQGLATTQNPGITIISAKIGVVSGSTTLNVTPAVLTSISVAPTNPSFPLSTAQQFLAIGIYSDDSVKDLTKDVTWSTQLTTVAIISNAVGTEGKATSVSVGSTSVIAALGAISGSTTLTVTPAVLTSISVTPTDPIDSIQTSRQFTATGIYSDNSVKDLTNVVTWGTQLTSVAIISNQANSKGLAACVGVGSTSVIATLGSIAGSTNLTVTPAVLTSIDIAPKNLRLPAGSEQFYTATGIYDNGRTQDITTSVTWQSSNINIATISNATGSEGLTFGIQGGTVTITASAGLLVGSTNLIVDNPVLQSITVTPVTPTIADGTQQQFIATGNYSDSSTKNLTAQATWISSLPSVAVISNVSGSNGLATGVAAGSTTITAAFNGVSGNTTLTVSSATLTSIAVTPTNASIPNGTNAQFTATGTYSDLSTEIITNEVTWTSSNNSIATISNAASTQGFATGVAVGTTIISAIKGSVTGSTTLSVINASIGDSLQGGKVACLNGGSGNLITANANNSEGIVWGGNGTTTNAQSSVSGGTNTTTIVTVLGPGVTYAAGVCDAYEIDSAGNTPCVAGNTCYNDWFLPATNQLSCMRSNRNKIGGFNKDSYWTSTEDSVQPNTNAFFLSFKNSGHPPDTTSKTVLIAVRCVRLINERL